MKDAFVKSAIAALCGLISVMSFWFLLDGISLYGNSGFLRPMISIVTVLVACVTIGWHNSKSLLRGCVGAILAMIIGIPLTAMIIIPIVEDLLQTTQIYYSSIASASFLGIWYLAPLIMIIELITDDVMKGGRWKKLIFGVFAGTLVLSLMEYVTLSLGNTSISSLLKLAFYASFLWGITLLVTNLSLKERNES